MDSAFCSDVLGYAWLVPTSNNTGHFWKNPKMVCETDDGMVKWSVDPENVDMVWYINFYNEDDYEKEVQIEITKVWEAQNYNDWV